MIEQKLWKKGWIRIAVAMFAVAFVLWFLSMGFGISEERRGILLWGEQPAICWLAKKIALVAIAWTVVFGLIEARRYEVRQCRHNH